MNQVIAVNQVFQVVEETTTTKCSIECVETKCPARKDTNNFTLNDFIRVQFPLSLSLYLSLSLFQNNGFNSSDLKLIGGHCFRLIECSLAKSCSEDHDCHDCHDCHDFRWLCFVWQALMRLEQFTPQ